VFANTFKLLPNGLAAFPIDNNVVEVYVHTTDIRGRENFHVGNYEEPLIDFLSIDTSGVDEMTSMNELLEKIQQKHKENGN